MPYYKKRKLAKFIKAVIDNEAETKRLIQTSENFWMSDFQYTPIARNSAQELDSRQNYFCWEFKVNEPMFWPVDLHPLAKGPDGGYQGDDYGAVTNDLHINQVRIGSEVKIKGIALEFMTWLKPQIPFMGLKVSLIRYARDDRPDKDNLYKNYTANRQLDMIDNRRFKVLKTWNFKHYQSPQTTLGTNIATDQINGYNWDTDAYSGPKVEKHLEGRTMQEWFDWIDENRPGYEMLSLDYLPNWWAHMAVSMGTAATDHSLSTGILKKPYRQEGLVQPVHEFAVVEDDGTVPDQNDYVASMFINLAQGSTASYIKQQFSSTGTVKAQQIFIIPKVGMANGTQDQIMVPVDKKHKLWIPGYMLGSGGTIHFKEGAEPNYERDDMIDHVLMFQTYINYKTWDYTTGATGSTPTINGRMTDFLQVTYFKDF